MPSVFAAAGILFACTPVAVYDGDGPIWCQERPHIRLKDIAAREMDNTCRRGTVNVAEAPLAAATTLVPNPVAVRPANCDIVVSERTLPLQLPAALKYHRTAPAGGKAVKGKQASQLPVRLAFEEASLRIPIDAIMPLRALPATVKKSVKYGQIAASTAEVGIIEPPVVARDAANPERYHLLDGHLRIEIERERGTTEIVCLVATDDEAFTYNKRISRIATIQEHRMILNAIKKGVSEERLVRAPNVDVASIRKKRNLLVGICPEAADLLKDRQVPIHVFTELRFMKAVPQVEAAMAMMAMNRFSVSYAKSLVAATPDDQLVTKPRRMPGLTED